ncbi:MAG: lycopene beta-cyclase CrtY [Sphingobium sp.]
MTDIPPCDIAIIGGGLSGGLIALALAARRPDLSVLLVESGDTLGGNHVWSFFDGDVDAANRWLIEPMIAHKWLGGHDVRFPRHARTLGGGYNSITSARFDAHVRAVLGERAMTGVAVVRVEPTQAVLADGRVIRAKAIIDARGFASADDPALAALKCGWQKFVGQSLGLTAPHGLTRPVIMDACVDQVDGYRFVYLLPLGEREIFVEDTYYSDDPALDVAAIRKRIAAYAAARGWPVEVVVHEETGVLPVVYGGDFARFWPADDMVTRAGVRAGLFHPMTGYSLRDAVHFAVALAGQELLDSDSLAQFARIYAARHWRAGGYYRLLGKMLFRAAAPQERYRIFARFYQLAEPLIARFYSGETSAGDKIRILCGRPPVPIRAAMRAVMKTND